MTSLRSLYVPHGLLPTTSFPSATSFTSSFPKYKSNVEVSHIIAETSTLSRLFQNIPIAGVTGLLKKLAPIVLLTFLLGALWGGSGTLLLTLL